MNENYIGQKIGKIKIIECLGKIRTDKNDNHIFWLGKCECGNYVYLRNYEIKNKTRYQCIKCSKPMFVHGKTNSKIFNAWQHMKGRCYTKSNKSYKDYGQRGIKMCDEWKNNFVSFYNWSINNGYKENLSIDRIDVNGDYEPSNCRWADKYTQANNKRATKYYDYNGKKVTIRDICNICGLSYNVIQSRIYNGWSIDKIIKQKKRGS